MRFIQIDSIIIIDCAQFNNCHSVQWFFSRLTANNNVRKNIFDRVTKII